MKRLKLRAQLLVTLIPAVLLPILIQGAYYFHQERNELIDRITSDMRVILNEYEGQFNGKIHEVKKDLELLSNSHLIRQYFLIEDNETRYYMLFRSVLELFKGFNQSENEYTEISLLDNSGKVEVRYSDSFSFNASDDESQADWFRQLQQDRTNTVVIPAHTSDFKEINLTAGKSIPLSSYSDWNSNSSVAYGGYLVVQASLTKLHNLLESDRIGENGFIVILNRNGEPLHLPDQAAFFKPFLVEMHRLTLSDDAEPHTATFAEKQYIIIKHHLYSDLDIYAVWPLSEANELVRDIYAPLLVLMGLITLAIVSAIVLLINQLVETPIRRLKLLSLQMANLSDENAISQEMDFSSFTRKDEISDLANTFRSMADNLRSTHDKLRQQAFYDSLTGLINRPMFNKMLSKAIANADRMHNRLAVLFVDIDGFKEVNDTLGHELGDQVLQDIGTRLYCAVRESDVIAVREGGMESCGLARFGGDEFALILTDLNHALDAKSISDRILIAVAQPFFIEQHIFHLSASIGIALYPDDGTNTAILLKNADIAMYQAKAHGKNQAEYFDHAMTQSAYLRHKALNELRDALNNGQLCLYYQPQIRTQTGELTGCEALVRWIHPERGLVSPAEFIPLAEESGLIVEIGRWVLEEACRQNKAWQAAGLKPIHVAVNFSTVQFNRETNIATLINDTLQRTGLDAQYLEVEITETGIMQSRHVGKDRLLAIKQIGVTISMDDFGTGYSSLAALQQFPLDKLKVDKSFVDPIATLETGSAIMNAILAMARELDLQVVAEGVETDLQRQYLYSHGCEFIQGYFISRPLPAQDMTKLLQQASDRPSAHQAIR